MHMVHVSCQSLQNASLQACLTHLHCCACCHTSHHAMLNVRLGDETCAHFRNAGTRRLRPVPTLCWQRRSELQKTVLQPCYRELEAVVQHDCRLEPCQQGQHVPGEGGLVSRQCLMGPGKCLNCRQDHRCGAAVLLGMPSCGRTAVAAALCHVAHVGLGWLGLAALRSANWVSRSATAATSSSTLCSRFSKSPRSRSPLSSLAAAAFHCLTC